MIAIKNKSDMDMCTSRWGNNIFVLTMEDLTALMMGYTLGDPNFNEYGTFIILEKEED